MFDSKTNITGRLTDAVDLMIDFATLGEYGLEPTGGTTAALNSVGRTRQRCADPGSLRMRSQTPPRRRRPARITPTCDLLAEAGFRKTRTRTATSV